MCLSVVLFKNRKSSLTNCRINVVEHISREDINSAFFKSMLEQQNGVDAIAIALLILHRIILTNTDYLKISDFFQ